MTERSVRPWTSMPSGRHSTPGSTATGAPGCRLREEAERSTSRWPSWPRSSGCTYDAGWMRFGWPERVGGLGGSTLTRAYLGEALTARDLVEPGLYSMTEVLAPTMIDYAAPELAAAMVPALLRGDETWCQGFSEPGHREATWPRCPAGPLRTDRGWQVTGQKVWTSLAQYAQRCVLLTRTGTAESAHRGITALFVDMDSPGITVRPIGTMHGERRVLRGLLRRRSRALRPHPRTRRGTGGPWPWTCCPTSAAPRSGTAPRSSHRRLQELLEIAPSGALDPARLGEVTQLLYAFRARSRAYPAPHGRR